MYYRYAKVRDSKGLNDVAVSRLSGVKQSTLSEWKRRSDEKPDARLSFENMVAIAKVLGVRIEDLI